MRDKPTAAARGGLRNVLALCMKISDNTNADCFFSYSAHCNCYSVYIYQNGWVCDDYAEQIDIATDITSENVSKTCAKLHEIYKELKEKKDEHAIL